MKKNPNLRIIGKRGRLYLPDALLKSLHLSEGSIVQAMGHNGAVVLVPMEVSPKGNPFADLEQARKEQLSEMTMRELYDLAAAAAAEYQMRLDDRE